MKILAVAAEVFYVKSRTGIYDKANSHFSHFGQSPSLKGECYTFKTYK
jgi:hypothetical protein